MDNNPITYLAELFKMFPGIGPRQARRFVYFLLSKDKEFVDNFTRQIGNLRAGVRQCSECFRFFNTSNYVAPSDLCKICSDASRDKTLLAVIEKDIDLDAMEKSGVFKGLYFVLGGNIPVLDKAPESKIRFGALKAKVEKMAAAGLVEIIIATGANAEGDHTADWIKDNLRDLAENHKLKISLLGRGLSTGSELEYADSETIRNALKNRA